MCNIAGYIGTKPAAPILIDMMRRQEGFDSGFFTGIATIHEGKIHVAKVQGDLDTLLRETNAASLPGTIGFIHGRTPGGPGEDAEWSHPFTTIRDGIVESALIENGCIRFFDPLLPNRIATAEKLIKDGYEFKSAFHCPERDFHLSDGRTMHYIDVLCQLVTQKIHNGADAVTALAEAECEYPTEMVALFLSITEPDAICWARTNFPMHLNFVDHGAYLATTPMAFPEDAGEPYLLPPMSSGKVTRDSLFLKPFSNPPAKVAPLDSKAYHDVYNMVYEALHREGGINLYTLGDVKPFFQQADIYPTGASVYRALYDIHRKEPLHIRVGEKVCDHNGKTAPQFFLSL